MNKFVHIVHKVIPLIVAFVLVLPSFAFAYVRDFDESAGGESFAVSAFGNVGITLGFANLTGMAFIAPSTQTTLGISVPLFYTGTPSDEVELRIYDDDSGNLGSLLAVSLNTFSKSEVDTFLSANGSYDDSGDIALALDYFVFGFDFFEFQSGETYHVILARTGALSNTDYWGAIFGGRVNDSVEFLEDCIIATSICTGDSDQLYVDTTQVGEDVDLRTSILSTYPFPNETVASGTPVLIGATGYVLSEDFEEGMYLQMSFVNQTSANVGGSALDAWNAAFGTGGADGVRIPITSSGSFDLSTTTTFLYDFGVTTGTYKIISPTFFSNLFFIGNLVNGNTLASRVTRFIIGAPTGLDIALEEGGEAVANYLLTGTTTVPVLKCSPVHFELTECLVSLVIPSAAVLKQDFAAFYNGVLSAVPFGYVTRFVTILVDDSAVEPPPLTYTFGSSSPATLQGETYSIQIFDQFDTLLEIRADDGTDKNIWDIVMPYFRTIIAIAVLLVILDDLLGFRLGRPSSESHGMSEVKEFNGKLYDGGKEVKVNDYSDMSESEWRNAKNNRLI